MYKNGLSPDVIADELGKHRATIYRWLKDIKLAGIRQFVRRKKAAKRRRQPTKLDAITRKRIIALRRQYGWCGQKIKKELRTTYGTSLCLMSVYRVLREEFSLKGKRRPYVARGKAPAAYAPREVIQYDTVDLGELYAYTAIDIFTKEPSVLLTEDLTSASGVAAFWYHYQTFGKVLLHQSDEGPEFMGDFPVVVTAGGASHRYARPYKKNDQAYIENFNRSLRSECVGWGKYQRADKAWLQTQVNQWLAHWHAARWHMGLPDMMTPAQHLEWYTKQQKVPVVAFAL